MLLLEITDLEQRQAAKALLGCRLDGPKPGATSATYGFELVGWALAEDAPLSRVEVVQEGRTVAETVPDEARRDIATAFPAVAHADRSGFRVPVGALDLRQDFELSVFAHRADGPRIEVGKVRGERATLPAGSDDLIQPLMVNTIGRSGSTWLVWLLSCLSESVSVSPWSADARVGSYWTSVLQTLARPQGYLAQLDPGPVGQRTWWFDRPDLKFGVGDSRSLEAWLGGEAVESLAGMCQSRIETFYSRLAGPGERPRFFVEKYLPHQTVTDLLAEMYPGSREVILVRDFRDMLCSVIAFNRKRGYAAFGRANAGSDAEYVETVISSSAQWLRRRLQERGEAAHLVRYEDLIQDPVPALEAIMGYLGLETSEQAIAATLERAEADSPKVDEHRTTDNISASIGRWKRDLPPELAPVCAEVLDPVLTEFGYEPTLAVASEG
jgi:hypothetical protein